MDEFKLNSMEVDTIGEVLNISLGAAATAVSNLLSERVDITTPVVSLKRKSEFEFKELEPAIGVEIGNEAGLTGSNIMLLKREDVRIIVGMLMGFEIPDEEFQLDEITSSAVGEIMNQMMGASATALSELLERVVDISTPVVFPIESPDAFIDKYFAYGETMVEVSFDLKISDKVESEFVYLIPRELATELVEGFFKDGVPDLEAMSTPQPPIQKEENIKLPDVASAQGGLFDKPQGAEEVSPFDLGVATPQAPVAQMQAVAPPVAPPVQPMAEPVMQQPMQQPVMQQPVMQQPVMQPMMQQPMMQPVMQAAIPDQLTQTLTQMMELMQKQMEMTQQMQNMRTQEPRRIKADEPVRPNFKQDNVESDYDANFEMVLGVPVEVAVEIGRTKKLVRDILELNKGSLVVLDRLAGEQVDLLVNGRCIAHGDVVVVDDSFAIRINEILPHEMNFGNLKE